MSVINHMSRLLALTGYEVRRTDAQRRSSLLSHEEFDLVLDVGAATGQYGAELRRNGYKGQILSFEPLDAAFAQLQRRVAGDKNWSVVQTAVGAHSETGTISIAGNSDSSSLLPMLARHEEVAPHTRYIGSQTIEIHTLDELALDAVQQSRNAYLKIDTQGYERFVLDGGPRVVALLGGVQIEMSLIPLDSGAMTFDEAIIRMLGEGFEMHLVEPGLRDPVSQQLLQMDGVFIRPKDA